MVGGQLHPLLFPYALSNFVESIGHYETHGGEVVGGAETAGREVALGEN